MTIFSSFSFLMTSQKLQPEVGIFGTKEANNMQMYVFGVVEHGKIPLTTNVSGKNHLQIGQGPFPGRLISCLDRFFAVFSNQGPIKTALDQSPAKDPEWKIQPDDCVGA